MGKAEKRARKKQGRRDRIEAETKAAEKRRKKNLNVVLAVVLVAAVALIAYNQLTRSPKKVRSAAPTPTPNASVTTDASSTVTAGVTSGATPAASPTSTAAACDTTKPPTAGSVNQSTPPPMTISPDKTYTATIDTSCGTIVAVLDAKGSPNTVNSFVYLAGKGLYNGLTFHRIVKDFAIQGGDPKGDGSGGPGYEVTDPVPADTRYSLGTLAMANAGTKGGAGSQFFIVPSDSAARSFQPLYAILGHVTSGLDAVTKLNTFPTVSNGRGEISQPAQPVYIKTITIQVT
ncbi:MAG: hypothetical protein NVSMB32_02700 [Actinomycetota bacterium]